MYIMLYQQERRNRIGVIGRRLVALGVVLIVALGVAGGLDITPDGSVLIGSAVLLLGMLMSYRTASPSLERYDDDEY